MGGSLWIGILERAQVQHALEGLDLDIRAGEALHDLANLGFLGGEVLAHRGGQICLLPRGFGAVGAAEDNGLAQRAHALEAFEVAAGENGRGGIRQVGQFIQGAQ